MKLSDLHGAKVGVWGFGREGRAAVRAIRARVSDAEVIVVTDAVIDDVNVTRELNDWGIRAFAGEQGQNELRTCTVVIHSPGVSIYRPEVRVLREAGIIVTSGTDIWFAENTQSTVIGVTGTKGKSTTTSLIAHILKSQRYDVAVAGNIGRPLLDLLDLPHPPAIVVAELSSHQTSDLTHSPDIAVVTNLYREHTDWHGTVGQYFEDKLNILRHREDVIAIFNGENETLREFGTHFAGVRWFGDGGRFHLTGDDICDGDHVVCSARDLPLKGRHNLLNTCAALTAVAAVGADMALSVDSLATFIPLPHRLQQVAVVHGRTYVDDSISTIPEATLAALDALGDVDITVLLGGYDRQQDYSTLIAELIQRQNIRGVITLPDNGERILAELLATNPACICEAATDLGVAVQRAAEITPTGGTVLLSPAAPSYGHFKNFEERGDAFRDAALGKSNMQPHRQR